MREFIFTIFGYFFGSILFSKVASRSLKCGDITYNSRDQNPGTVNAFKNGGFWCGLITLLGDFFKGFLPVWLYLLGVDRALIGLSFALVLAAPVIGHIFPVFYRFHGGKGIATTFGCFLGLLPDYVPLFLLVVCFIMFSCVIRITPNFYCTIATYLVVGILLVLFESYTPVICGFFLIMAAVGIRLWMSKEEKGMCKVRFLWKH